MTFPLCIHTHNGRARSVDAYPSECPTLCVHQPLPADAAECGPWVVTHTPSGRRVWRHAATIEEAFLFIRIFRERLGDYEIARLTLENSVEPIPREAYAKTIDEVVQARINPR